MTQVADTPAPSSRRARFFLAGIIVLAAVLRLFRLGHQSLWIDEIMTLIVATPKPGHPILTLLRYNVHGPLHTFVVYLMRFAGEGDAWLRLPSALAGIASVPLLYAWARRRMGERVGLWSALLLAINPLHIRYSQELRNYAFVVFFVLAGCVAVDRACERWSMKRAAAAGACVAGALLSNFSAAFVFVAQSLTFFRHLGYTKRSLTRWLAVTAVALVLAWPWIYRLTTYVNFERLATPVLPGELTDTERLRGATTFSPEAVPYAAFAYSVGFSLGPSLRELHENSTMAGVMSKHGGIIAWVAVLFGGLALAAIVDLLRSRRGGRLWELLSYILIPLAATLLLNWQNAKAFNVRYVIVGLPMYMALLACGAVALGSWRGRIALVLVVATNALSLVHYYADPAYAKEDVRDAVHAVEKRMQPGDCIFAPTVWQIVQHYRTGNEPVHYIFPGVPGEKTTQLQGLFDACPVFWYIRARPWVADPRGRLVGAIEAKYEATESLEVPGVSVTRYRRREVER